MACDGTVVEYWISVVDGHGIDHVLSALEINLTTRAMLIKTHRVQDTAVELGIGRWCARLVIAAMDDGVIRGYELELHSVSDCRVNGVWEELETLIDSDYKLGCECDREE